MGLGRLPVRHHAGGSMISRSNASSRDEYDLGMGEDASASDLVDVMRLGVR